MIDSWTIAKGLLLYTGIVTVLFAALAVLVWALSFVRLMIREEGRKRDDADREAQDSLDHDRALTEKARREAMLRDPNSVANEVWNGPLDSTYPPPYPKNINHG